MNRRFSRPAQSGAGNVVRKTVDKTGNKLTDDQVIRARQLASTGLSHRDILAELGNPVAVKTLSAAINGSKYTYLNDTQAPVVRQKTWTPKEDQVLIAMYMAGYTEEEINETLGRSGRQATKRLYELRQKGQQLSKPGRGNTTNHKRNLTDATVMEMRRLRWDEGLTADQIITELDLDFSATTVRRATNGATYAHLPMPGGARPSARYRIDNLLPSTDGGFTSRQVKHIREMHAMGHTVQGLACAWHVHPTTISKMVNRQTYIDVL